MIHASGVTETVTATVMTGGGKFAERLTRIGRIRLTIYKGIVHNIYKNIQQYTI